MKILKLKINTNIERKIKNNFLLVYTKVKRYSQKYHCHKKKEDLKLLVTTMR